MRKQHMDDNTADWLYVCGYCWCLAMALIEWSPAQRLRLTSYRHYKPATSDRISHVHRILRQPTRWKY